MSTSILLFLFSFLALSYTSSDIFKERSAFHIKFCQVRPLIRSCVDPFTEKEFQIEIERHKEDGKDEHQKSKRAAPWYRGEEDDEYEYYMWRKYQKEKMRRRMGLSSASREVHYHYHERPRGYGYGGYPGYSRNYYYPSYRPSYYYPSYYSYPSYGYGGYGGYPSYGYGGGYGGGLGGGLFNIGFGRHLGISTPIGGFGYSSGFGIGIGK